MRLSADLLTLALACLALAATGAWLLQIALPPVLALVMAGVLAGTWSPPPVPVRSLRLAAAWPPRAVQASLLVSACRPARSRWR